MELLRDRINGCILGGILGDAFGAPLEGASQAGLATQVERRASTRAPWGYTDDSAMLLACCEALCAVGTIEPTSLLRALANRYEPARGFGRGMKIALTAFESGTRWERCAYAAWPEGSRGNGGAVRVPPIAVARWPDATSFDLAVRLATRVTHAHEEAVAFAHLHATAIATVIENPSAVDSPQEFCTAIRARLGASAGLVAAKLDAVYELAARGVDQAVAARELGTSTLACESVPAALWSFLSSHKSFSDAVCSAALLGGDVDSICCLVGALAGALHGVHGISDSWLANLSHERPSPVEVLALAGALADLSPTRPATPG